MRPVIMFIAKSVFLSFLFVGCRHGRDNAEEDNACPYGCCEDQSLESMKDYFFYKSGTQWVYEELNTGQKDTITVTAHSQSVTQEGYSQFSFFSNSAHDGYHYDYFYNDSFTADCLHSVGCKCKKLERIKYDGESPSGEERIFFYPMTVEEFTYAPAGGVSQVVQFYDSLNLQGEVYRNVYKLHVGICRTEDHDLNGLEDGVEVDFFIAKNRFIVRKVIPAYNEDWVLINSIISQ